MFDVLLVYLFEFFCCLLFYLFVPFFGGLAVWDTLMIGTDGGVLFTLGTLNIPHTFCFIAKLYTDHKATLPKLGMKILYIFYVQLNLKTHIPSHHRKHSQNKSKQFYQMKFSINYSLTVPKHIT